MTASPTLPPIVALETAAALVDQHAPVQIIVVRTPVECASAHIPGSYNVPLDLLPEHRDELRDTLRAPVLLRTVSCDGREVVARLRDDSPNAPTFQAHHQ